MARPELIVVNTDLQDPVHLQVSDQIQALIERGELEPETRLPTVRELARDLEIAPNTVVRAYATLQDAGFVVSDGRRGTKVARGKRVAKRARNAALRALVLRTIESLRYRGYSAGEIADVFGTFAQDLRAELPSAHGATTSTSATYALDSETSENQPTSS